MKASDFAKKALEIARDYHTSYIWGGLGRPITEASLAGALEQYPEQNPRYVEAARRYVGDEKGFCFDCIGLIKSILWGWNGDHDAPLGGAAYASNGVPDTSADHAINQCSNVSPDFENVLVGEALWLPGHIGIYVGNGLAVECTPAFENGVQITNVMNIGIKPGYATRFWHKHGMLPWVDYGDPIQAEVDALPNWSRPAIQKLVDAGALTGDGKSLNLTDDLTRTLVILDRMKMFG